ncbi:MAG: S1 family peptidase [Bdellovibrionales bacterium]|nr:S1 family peptidase [Bdellovibrionales bacterium]
MRRLSLLVLISLSVFNFACSKQKTSPTLQFETREEALKVLNGDQVRCENADCPEAVGALYIMHKINPTGRGYTYQMGLCSGTLVSPNQVLTNRHCFDDIASEGEDLRARGVDLQMKFPAVNGKGFFAVRGRRILKMSKKGSRSMTPDWALVELDSPVPRKPSDMASLAFNDEIQVQQPPVQVFPVYFDKSVKPIFGLVKSVSCQLKSNDNFSIFSFTGDSAIFNIEQCSEPIVKGNSGSGLFLKENAKLLGVVAMTGGTVAYGTMASCVPSLSENSRSCYFSEDEAYGRVANSMSFASATYRSQVMDLARTLDRSKFSAFRWQDEALSTRLQNIQPEWTSPWQSLSAYLEQKNADRLRRQFAISILRVYFPNIPSCVVESAILPRMSLPVVKINWTFVYGYEGSRTVWRDWKEVTHPDGSSNFHTTRWDRQDLKIETVETQTKKESAFVSFEGEMNNSLEPLKKFRIRLPVCK